MSTDKGRDAADNADDAQEADDSGSGPDQGAAMSQAGAEPSGSEMAHWNTASPHADASEEGPVTGTVSKPLPGEKDHAEKADAAKIPTTDD
jgi:hypothetical protein